MRWLLIRLIRGYQLLISPFMAPSCRFEPTCSHYALEALRVHGAGRGGWLALKRLGRCQPFSQGGYDPVPEAACSCHKTSAESPVCDDEQEKNCPSSRSSQEPWRPLPVDHPTPRPPMTSGADVLTKNTFK